VKKKEPGVESILIMEKNYYEGNFLNGVKNGRFSYYYESGQIKRKENYDNGVKEGLWEYLDESGNVNFSIEYKEGKEIKYNGEKISYGRRVDRELEEEEQEN